MTNPVLGLWAVLLLAVVRVADAQTLSIYHIDVDQASATLFVSPAGRTLLVDSGRNGQGSRVRAALDAAAVNRIDHLVTTHYHEDHYGGIDEVVDAGTPVGLAYDRGDKAFLPRAKLRGGTYRGYDRTVGHRATHLTRGMTISLDPLVTVTCTNAGGVVLGESDPPQHGADENDMSIGLLVVFGGFRYWIGGDTEEPTERKLAARDVVREVDVYVADHHGADNGSSADFLADLNPTVVIISNGNNRQFRHPRKSTLERLRTIARAPAIFQLNKYLGTGDDGGNVEDEFIADLEATDGDGTIVLTVTPGTSSYTVTYRGRVATVPIRSPTPLPLRALITRLLPDPVAEPDRDGETVTIRNETDGALSLDGWLLRGRDGRVWTLSGLAALGVGGSATVRRNGMPMPLVNTGGTLALVDPAGQVADSIGYQSSRPGREIVLDR